jgi:ribosomal protein S18 acetylase RimI-like enzyme
MPGAGDGWEIREPDEGDLDLCAGMMSVQDPWLRLEVDLARCMASISEAHLQRYGIFEQGAIVGLAAVHPTGMAFSPYLSTLVIRADRTGRGLGSRLLAHVEETVFRTHRNLFLCVSSFNENARRFYLTHGYATVGRIPDYVKPGYDEWIMRKVKGEGSRTP